MKLDPNSISWAIKHLFKESDTDLFPKPLELSIIHEMHDKVLELLSDVDLGNYQWNASRRFLIPKSELSYRLATQLDPIDSIMIAAIMFQFGHQIESRRISVDQNKVFSYRFSPTTEGCYYSNNNSWIEFWKTAKKKSEHYKYVTYLDISDFYNQIYHHVIENQLIASGLPNQVKKSICALLESVTQTVSRGIPIGPHSMHLVAEMSLIPVDDSLVTRKYDFCRYVDDSVPRRRIHATRTLA